MPEKSSWKCVFTERHLAALRLSVCQYAAAVCCLNYAFALGRLRSVYPSATRVYISCRQTISALAESGQWTIWLSRKEGGVSDCLELQQGRRADGNTGSRGMAPLYFAFVKNKVMSFGKRAETLLVVLRHIP